MRSMQWQLGMLGTVSAFAYRHREMKKNLFRGGWPQDLPNSDLQPAVRQIKYVRQQYTHSATNTHKIYNNTHKTSTKIYTTTNNNVQKRQQYTQYISNRILRLDISTPEDEDKNRHRKAGIRLTTEAASWSTKRKSFPALICSTLSSC